MKKAVLFVLTFVVLFLSLSCSITDNRLNGTWSNKDYNDAHEFVYFEKDEFSIKRIFFGKYKKPPEDDMVSSLDYSIRIVSKDGNGGIFHALPYGIPRTNFYNNKMDKFIYKYELNGRRLTLTGPNRKMVYTRE